MDGLELLNDTLAFLGVVEFVLAVGDAAVGEAQDVLGFVSSLE